MIALSIASGALAVVAWFARRARIGARARSAAGVRLRSVDAASEVLARVSVRLGCLGLLAGVVAAGPFGAFAGAAAGLAWRPLERRRALRAFARRIDEQLPEVLRALAAGLRAGRNLHGALEGAAEEAPEPIRSLLVAILARISVGLPLRASLDAFAAAARTEAAASAVDAIQIGAAAGGNLPAILDIAVESICERERLARDRRAATAQARLSAVVVGAMPLAFFALLGSGARAQLDVLFGDPIGWALLAAGCALEVAGVLWMRALMRPA